MLKREYIDLRVQYLTQGQVSGDTRIIISGILQINSTTPIAALCN